jgi:hypothetical protein
MTPEVFCAKCGVYGSVNGNIRHVIKWLRSNASLCTPGAYIAKGSRLEESDDLIEQAVGVCCLSQQF